MLKENIIGLNFVMGIGSDERRLSEPDIFSTKYFRIEKGNRTLIKYAFDFIDYKIGKTDSGDNLMIQVINDLGNEQLTFKIPKICLENTIITKDISDLVLNIKEDYMIGFNVNQPYILFCKKESHKNN